MPKLASSEQAIERKNVSPFFVYPGLENVGAEFGKHVTSESILDPFILHLHQISLGQSLKGESIEIARDRPSLIEISLTLTLKASAQACEKLNGIVLFNGSFM